MGGGGGRKRHRDRRGKPEVCVARTVSKLATNSSRTAAPVAAASGKFDGRGNDDSSDAHSHNPGPTPVSSTVHRRAGGRKDTNFYDAKETKRYTAAAAHSGIQDELAWRTLHLIDASLKLARPAFVLDVGIGAGACADVVERLTKALHPRRHTALCPHGNTNDSDTSNTQSAAARKEGDDSKQDCSGRSRSDGRLHEAGSTSPQPAMAGVTGAAPNPRPWTIVGIDKSQEMLEAGSPARDRFCVDFCQGLPFRRGADFDAVLSVSALQWLCVGDPRDDEPVWRFMRAAWDVLRPDGGVLVAQFYPTVPGDTSRLLSAARRLLCAGGDGGGGGAAVATTNSENLLLPVVPPPVPSAVGCCEVIMDMPHRNKTKRLFLRMQKKRSGHVRGAEAERQKDEDGDDEALPQFCPCAWPHEATCALDLHLRHDSVWSKSVPFLHEVSLASAASGEAQSSSSPPPPPAAAAAVEVKGGARRTSTATTTTTTTTTRRKRTKVNDSEHAWLQRLRDTHNRLAKTFQSSLQVLWQQQQQQLQAESLLLQRRGAGRRQQHKQHNRHSNTKQLLPHFMQRRVGPVRESPETASGGGGGGDTRLDWTSEYERRARIEAWLCGSREKADEKHLGSFWDSAVEVGVGRLVQDAENCLRDMGKLKCFQHCNLFLLSQPKGKGGSAKGKRSKKTESSPGRPSISTTMQSEDSSL